MPGSLTTPGRPSARDDAPGGAAFHHLHGVGTQNRKLSRLNGWLCAPLSTLRRGPHGQLRMTRGRCGSVGYDRGADRASNDADVSSIPPIIPYGGFSPVRLEGWPFRRGPSQYIGQLKPAPGMRWSVSGLRPSFVRLVTSAMAPL